MVVAQFCHQDFLVSRDKTIPLVKQVMAKLSALVFYGRCRPDLGPRVGIHIRDVLHDSQKKLITVSRDSSKCFLVRRQFRERGKEPLENCDFVPSKIQLGRECINSVDPTSFET